MNPNSFPGLHRALQQNITSSNLAIADFRLQPLEPAPLHTLRVVGLMLLVMNVTVLLFWRIWHKNEWSKRLRAEDELDEGYLASDAALTTMLEMGRVESRRHQELFIDEFMFDDESCSAKGEAVEVERLEI